MPEASWDAGAMPGTVPEAEASERVPTPKLEVDIIAGKQDAAAQYEAFVNDQLNALKHQLLAYHNYQCEPLHGGSSMAGAFQQRAETTIRTSVTAAKEHGQKVTAAKEHGQKAGVKAWSASLVLDVLTHPRHAAPEDDDTNYTHRAASARASYASADGLVAAKLSTVVYRKGDPNPIWTRFALTEKNLFRQIWSQVVVGLLLIYIATVFPYKLAFLDFRIGNNDEEALEWYLFQWVVDTCFWIDLGLSFFMSYRNEDDSEVCDIRKIARRYLTGMFLLDLLACVPSAFFQLVFLQGDSSTGGASPTRAVNLTKLQRLSRLLRILRLRQLSKLAHLEVVQTIMRFRGFRMGGLFLGFCWVVHMMGCGWYICAALENNPLSESWVARRSLPDGTTLLDKGPEDQWLHSAYFVLTVFTTVGFGDISAFTSGEIFYVGMLMVMGGVINGVVLSHVMNILQESDRKELGTQQTVNILRDFADHTELNQSVTNNLVQLARQSRNSAELDSAKVKKLFGGLVIPRTTMSELAPKLWKGKLFKNEFFKKPQALRQTDLPPRLYLFVASMLKMRDFPEAGEIVYSKGDMPMNCFLVLVGTFSFVDTPIGQTTAEVSPYQLFGTRSYFGEYDILTGAEGRMTTARCEVPFSIALLLARSDLLALCDDFPAFGAAQRILMARREASRKRRLGKLTQHRSYEELCYQAIFRWIHKHYGRHQRSERSCNLVTVIPKGS
eukprot:TRINITY_DN6141_c0_g1_i2.p1 TRINITY_DN6141_c0_g1~~TRINITY_DN6141_c0_g1_i2.p1  ORF type:complete len:725 (+),score=94.67 TRINITY_DN6141_c0_g1_i2:81-2255(+)